MRTWIFTLFGLGAILGGAYMIYLKWDTFVEIFLILLGFFLILLGISLLSGPRIYMMQRRH
jgi:hypothetical protein